MPGLVLFNRKWAIASDDFVFPSIVELLLRFMWIIALASIDFIHRYEFDCHNGSILRNVYTGTIVLDIVGIINTTVLMSISMKGSIKNNWPRRHVRWSLYIKVALLLPELVWMCICTYWMFGLDFSCDWTVVWTARGTVLCSWLVGFLIFVGILVVFDPMGAADQRTAIRCSVGSEHSLIVGGSPANKVWENRCRLLCCCIACQNDTQDAFTNVGKIVAGFFHDLDLVPTDIGAGLMLVLQQQRGEATVRDGLQEVRVLPASPESNVDIQVRDFDLNLPEPKYWMTVSNMAHYMRFVMGSYGWPLYIYSNLCTGLCGLCCSLRCCACLRNSHGVYMDNNCECNTAAIKKWTKKLKSTLVYVSFHNTFKQVPFYVAADHAKNAVVVSIRGTMSLKDGLADLSATGALLEVPGLGEDSVCHSAMLDCARYIQGRLDSLGVLAEAFAKLKEGADLVVTGHSLGAGVAAILSILLRPTYPDVMCFAFSPPGGLLSPSLAEYTRDFVCSVVVGKDLVPRLGMITLTDLKVKVLKALLASDTPKYRILARGFLRLLCCCLPDSPSSETPEETPLSPSGERIYSLDGRNSIQTHTMQESLTACERNMERHVRRNKWPQKPPGQIFYIKNVSPNRHDCCRPGTSYVASWTNASTFGEIVLSRSMLSDHLPNVVLAALEELVQSEVQTQR